jgi:hypothetical protein
MTTKRDVTDETERLRSCVRLDALVHELMHCADAGADCLPTLEEICAAFRRCEMLGIRSRDAAMLLMPIRKMKATSPFIVRLQETR